MSSKAPAFQFYAADYLADEAVNLMSLEAEGAYTRLLAYCWREGSIPANEAQLSRLCKGAPSEVIQEVIGCFYADAAQPGRLLHKRLESERAKQEEFRARQAAKGQKGGRPKKPDESPEKPPAFSGLNRTKADGKPGESSSSSTSTSTKVDEEKAAAPEEEQQVQPLKADKPKRALPPPPEDAPLFTADSWVGLTNPATFASICTDLRLPIDLDRESYRAAIQDKIRSLGMEAPATTLRSWINSYFLNEKKKPGGLLTVTQGLPTKPTPKNELPAPGKEIPGQVLAFQGENDDYVNRTRRANYERHWPAAQIHIISPR